MSVPANVNSQQAHHAIVAEQFSKASCKALLKAGVVLVGVQLVPGEGNMGWANSRTCYVIEYQGCGYVKTHAEVLAYIGK